MSTPLCTGDCIANSLTMLRPRPFLDGVLFYALNLFTISHFICYNEPVSVRKTLTNLFKNRRLVFFCVFQQEFTKLSHDKTRKYDIVNLGKVTDSFYPFINYLTLLPSTPTSWWCFLVSN